MYNELELGWICCCEKRPKTTSSDLRSATSTRILTRRHTRSSRNHKCPIRRTPWTRDRGRRDRPPRRLTAMALVLFTATISQPFYPLYSRPVTSLDGEWSFSFTKEFNGTLETLDVSSIKTPESITVPSAFDVAQPGVQGRRGAAFYRRNITLKKGRAGRLQFAACSFFCRAFVDGVEVGRHFAGGYVPFWLEVPPSTTSSTRELFVRHTGRGAWEDSLPRRSAEEASTCLVAAERGAWPRLDLHGGQVARLRLNVEL